MAASLNMCRITLLLTCLASVGRGQISTQRSQKTAVASPLTANGQIRSKSTNDPLQTFARFILSFTSAAAFQPSNSGVYLPSFAAGRPEVLSRRDRCAHHSQKVAFLRSAFSGHSAHRSAAPRAAADTPAGTPLTVDVAVIGGGPAGYTMAALLHGTHGHTVALVDPSPEREWPNNYGSWFIEWEALSRRLSMPELLTDCIGKQWPITDCYFGGSWGMPYDQRLRLDRPYIQVDRKCLKAAMSAKFGSGVTVLPSSLRARTIAPNLFDGNLAHDADGSTMTLADGTSIRAKLVVDASGFESKLVTRETDVLAGLSQPLPPGYQIAYGFSVEIEGDKIDPYDTGAMTLFDYRTDHFEAEVASATDAAAKAKAEAELQDAEVRPSFMYVMPDKPAGDGYTRAFFEETSLVGRDGRRLEFSTLKKRAMTRLKFLGLKIREGSLQEEEYCYIPMGGNLPDLSQRIVAIGGAAATVHPSTGYQLCRMLASASDVSAAISTALKQGASPDVAAGSAYSAMWSPQLRYQRDFQVFGGEFLGDQPVDKLRGFFDAFFKLDEKVWGGFLAGWPGLPGNEYHDEWNKRLAFGLSLAVKFPPQVAVALVAYAVTFSWKYGLSLLRSFLTPLFGTGGGLVPFEREVLDTRITKTYIKGDMAAKREALDMIRSPDGRGEASPQVAEVAEIDETLVGAAQQDGSRA